MKPSITAVFAVLSFGLSALADPQALYVNYGVVTNAPVIDATAFLNEGIFEPGENLNATAQTPFSTRDTYYYTNSGLGALMLCQPRFDFQTFTSNATYTACSVYNTGSILGVDVQTAPEIVSFDGSPFEFAPGTGIAYPSLILISATNVYNGRNGIISVGADGLLRMYGNNVTNNGSLVAGNLTDLDLFDGEYASTTLLL